MEREITAAVDLCLPGGRLDPAAVGWSRRAAASLRTELHWALGHFRGTVVSDDGERIAIDQLLGWAEEHRARW